MSRSATPNPRTRLWWVLGLVGVGALVAAVMVFSSDAAPPSTATTGDAVAGEALFAANCLPCHGPGATGTDSGPPLVHDLYVPGHHSDAAFTVAVRNGVRPHHWQFGPMAPISGLSDQDVGHIVAYVRSLQRAAGILEDAGA